MDSKKIRKILIELTPVQMIWLHSQHVFQKIEEDPYFVANQIKFFKNNIGVEIKFQTYSETHDFELLKEAKAQLQQIIESNEIRLIQTSLHKDLYIKISKEARRQFPNSYIIFLHYETFENCCRKLQDKFNITNITPQLERLRKLNYNFCFLIAEKDKIDDIEKFTNRILHSEVSCASTTFSHNHSKKELMPLHSYKKTMSVSSLRGSFSDQNQQQTRLSVHNNSEEDMFEVNQTCIIKLNQTELEKVSQRKIMEGCSVYIQKREGHYHKLSKRLYWANRLQQASNPHLQPIYAYCMSKKNLYNYWCLSFVTDKKYKKLSDMLDSQFLANSLNKIQVVYRIGKALRNLHLNYQSYGDLSDQTILLDQNRQVYLSSIIQKQVPPYVYFIFDMSVDQPTLVRHPLVFVIIYKLFTQVQLSYQMLMEKECKQQYFCSLNYKCKNTVVNKFMSLADQLFIKDITLEKFLLQINKFNHPSHQQQQQ